MKLAISSLLVLSLAACATGAVQRSPSRGAKPAVQDGGGATPDNGGPGTGRSPTPHPNV